MAKTYVIRKEERIGTFGRGYGELVIASDSLDKVSKWLYEKAVGPFCEWDVTEWDDAGHVISVESRNINEEMWVEEVETI